jgi:hypothetical protein
LNNNFGSVGQKYAEFLGAHFAQIAKDVETLSAQLNTETHSLQEERFWISLIATILLGAKYANILGCVKLDEVGLKDFMLHSLDNMRMQRATQTVDLTQKINVSSILAAFCKEVKREGKWLVTSHIHVAVGKPPKPGSPGAVKVIFPTDTSRLHGAVVQVGVNDKLMRIASSAWGQWLKKNGYNRNNVMEAMAKTVTLTKVNGFVGGGCGLAGPKEHIIELDLNSSTDLDFIDEN